jgi:hypothetical protein
MLAGVQHDGFYQAGAEAFLQDSKAAQVIAADPAARLDLEGDHLAVITLKYEIHLITRLGAEVPGRYRRVRPADLLEDLPYRERFEQVAVLGKRRGCGLRDLLRAEIQQPGHDTGIDHVHFGVPGDPGAEGRPPRGETVDEEDGLEELDVVLRSGPVQADSSADRRYVKHLAGPGSELAEQPGQHLALPDARDIRDVLIDD